MINTNYHSTKLKGDCGIYSVHSKKSSSVCEEDNDKHKEKEFVDKSSSGVRKKKLFALTKGLNITNVSKLNDGDLNKNIIKTKNRLKKIINTDSSSDEAYDDNIVIKENGKRRKKKKKLTVTKKMKKIQKGKSKSNMTKRMKRIISIMQQN